MATIAGLAKAPSRYSPLRSMERATTRRNLVIDKMAKYGYINAEEAATWQAAALVLKPYNDVFPDRAPYFAEHVRRYVTERYGADALLQGKLRIETTVVPVIDGAAATNVDFGARKQDKRQGWRGPEWYVEGKARDIFLQRAAALYGDGPLEPGRRYLGLVQKVSSGGAQVQVGTAVYDLPLGNMKWAAPWSRTEASNDNEIESAGDALKVGDVIWVSREQLSRDKFRDWFLLNGANPRWEPRREASARARKRPVRLALEQVPHPQSAIFTADHTTGYVLALAGGHDFTRSEFNRAVQACRQPGSTYKPIYYSTALDEGYGYDTILNDRPRQEVDPVTGDVWTPTNLGGTVDDQVSLEYAMVFSKNIPSVEIFKKVGAAKVEAWARRLGFTTEIIADQALALGASCTQLDELTRAFAIFARNGRWIDWVYVRRIVDSTGRVLEDNTVLYDPMLRVQDRLDRVHATAGIAAKQAIPARTAYLTSKLLRRTIKYGFAYVLRQTGIVAAGKTGTSSATMDTSFVGYTSRWITSVWLGDDRRVRPLGRDDAAYMTVVPLWARYMYETAKDYPSLDIPWEQPPGVDRKDRGDHSKGETLEEPMELVYRKSHAPENTENTEFTETPASE
jgi:penicillin-binding protein 1A